ncbi:MAG TPA: electron transfer flavoprotein subunit alpha/FixB family protein [Candidatus Dormibacteraeota bacterium]|nr:electron transfer flavoprotein subunit alpha/FixB family protein [Candidatus Dormibacteraeota bacterium]
MAGAIWVVGGTTPDGGLARISAEVATLARTLAEAAGRDVAGVVVAADASGAAEELSAYLPRVLAVSEPLLADHEAPSIIAERVATLASGEAPAFLFVDAGPDGRDVAGVLEALLGWGVLVNATGAEWEGDGPVVEMSVFGGSLVTRSAFSAPHGIVTVRPNTVTAQVAPAKGVVDAVSVAEPLRLPTVQVVDRVAESGAQVAIEEARIVVAGGRGVGGPDGFHVVEELAAALGGAVGATRAAVDSGWINYAHQIGQTGKTVKPQLYLALGISGAIQHKVGMQLAETIVAINRDPDAPLAEFADMYVVGDLFEVAPALLAALRARGG